VNVEGTRNVLEACVKFGVKRIVHFSTIGVHGPYLHEGMDENSPFIKYGNPYADSKIEAEQLFWNYLSDKNLERVVVRPTYVWGPNSPWFTIVPVKNIIEKRFALVDEGKGACNAVYVDNVVDLAVLAGVNSRAVGEAFFIRDPDRMTWREFFGYYALIAKVDPAVLNSVSSNENLKTVLSRNIKKFTNEAKKNLTISIDKYEERYPFVVRYGLKAPRKILGMVERIVESVAPTTYNWWDLKKYSSPGHISIEKAKRLLDYWPRVAVADGMNATETWLKEQNYVPNSPLGDNSKYDRSELS
jgi:nucleoside-diphosphate-sugar epimerase